MTIEIQNAITTLKRHNEYIRTRGFSPFEDCAKKLCAMIDTAVRNGEIPVSVWSEIAG